MKIGCILLAAGAGVRFGGGKLTALLDGKPVIEYILDSISKARFSRRIIVAGNQALLETACRHGLDGIVNNRPELGVSRSIRMGLDLMEDTEACMFCVADQPLLSFETLSGMLRAYTPNTILKPSNNGNSGNPVIFPASLYGELQKLTGEESGKTVACRHSGMLRQFPINDSTQLKDIDTREDLFAMEAHLTSHPDSRQLTQVLDTCRTTRCRDSSLYPYLPLC